MSRAGKLLVAAAFVAGGALARDAAAQPATDPAAAEALFNSGRDLVKAGDWPGGCAKFRASMDLDPAVGTMIKIAKCDEHDGKLALAWYDYQRALSLNRERSGASAARKKEFDEFLKGAVAELEPRVPKLRVTIAPRPDGLTVTRDGRNLPVASLGDALPTDPGDHELVVSAPGFETIKRVVALAEGKTVDADFSLVATAGAATPAVPAPTAAPIAPAPTAAPIAPAPTARPPASLAPTVKAPPPDAPASSKGKVQRGAGVVVGVAGVVVLGVAGSFAIRVNSKVSESNSHCKVEPNCDSTGYTLREDARGLQTAGLVLLGVGVAALAAGVVIVATAPADKKPRAALVVGPGGVAARARW